MHRFDHGIAHRHLHEVAAVAAVGIAPIGPCTTGPQSLVGFLEEGERVVVAAGVDIGHVGGHLHRGELVGQVAVAQLPVVVGAPGV